MPEPLDDKLWAKAKRRVKARVSVWPSAYASGQLVQEYKRMGGEFKGAKRTGDLARWYKEKWVDVCEWPKRSPCGREAAKEKSDIRISNYPYCRPSVKVSTDTPTTVQQMSPKAREAACAKKRRSPKKRMPAAKKN